MAATSGSRPRCATWVSSTAASAGADRHGAARRGRMALTSNDLAPGRAVVTGGAGFLGSHLCRRLLELGCEVVCVDNLLTGAETNIAGILANPAMSFVRQDISQPFEIDGAVDYVLHFAS